eukprot:2825725-Prymnesium_polylepis.1
MPLSEPTLRWRGAAKRLALRQKREPNCTVAHSAPKEAPCRSAFKVAPCRSCTNGRSERKCGEAPEGLRMG